MQHDFILLDRSGSMASMWNEALGAVNSYVKKLAEDNVDTGVTLAVFDSDNPFEIVRDRIIPKSWNPVTNAEVQPRNLTPLNDATAKLLNLAEQGPPWGGQYDKVAIIVMTDGAENASHEFKDPGIIRARLDACRKKGWQIIYLGANFDNQAQAMSYGTGAGQTISTSAVNIGATMQGTATLRSAYGLTGQAMNYSQDFKNAVKSEEKIDPTTLRKPKDKTTSSSSTS